MFKLLYRTGKTEKEFSKLEWVEKPRKENEEISPFFQKYLKNIFPELIFVFKENKKETTRYKFSKGRELDAICWYPKGEFFIIFEYKSVEPRKKIDQIIDYLDAFSCGDNEDCINLLADLNNSFLKDESVSWKNVKWKELKLVWISPQIPSSKSKYSEVPDIIWVESEWYENGSEIAVRLESKDKENLLEQLSKEIETTKPKIERLPQLLQKIGVIGKEIEEWSKKIHKVAIEKFSLTFKLHYYPNWWYNGVVSYEKWSFWITIGKDYLKVYFSSKVGRKEGIRSENNLSESLSIIEEIFTKQRRNNE